MSNLPEIKDLIPHREPFLFVDKIKFIDEKKIETSLLVKDNSDFFRGHYPHMPLMPGVLISEAVFQSAAIFISYHTSWAKQKIDGQGEGAPVLTRIKNAKFKSMVLPGDLLDISAELDETVSHAWYMKGKVSVGSKQVLYIEFAVNLVNN